MDISILLIQSLNAFKYGLLLFLVASGLPLIFGIMGIINLAHGSFYMIGAYMAFALGPVIDRWLGGGFITTLAVCLPVPPQPPAAGVDDLRPDPGVRGTAQHPGGQRRARRAVARLAARQHLAG
ncbi:hypothetical protein G6F32_015758 [Rhizopus arrhizus]|nr:hypothetical protein G6F32_015758 [Rhizopus arrhizus]